MVLIKHSVLGHQLVTAIKRPLKLTALCFIRMAYVVLILSLFDVWSEHFFGKVVFSARSFRMDGDYGMNGFYNGFDYHLNYYRTKAVYGPEIRYWFPPMTASYLNGKAEVHWN
jgi:hypothetical protein